MLTPVQRQAVFDGIPYILAGVPCTKVLSKQYIENNAAILPSITVNYLSEGERARWKGQEIRSTWNEKTLAYDCAEGLIGKATIGLTISSEDYSQVMNMAADMIMQLYRDRLNMTWWDCRVKLIETLGDPIIDSYRYEPDRDLVFRAHVDIWIEYEISWPVIAPAIWLYDSKIEPGNFDTNDFKPIELVMYAPGLYGMVLTLIAGDKCWYTIDMLLKNAEPMTYTTDMILYYGGTPASYDVSMTLI